MITELTDTSRLKQLLSEEREANASLRRYVQETYDWHQAASQFKPFGVVLEGKSPLECIQLIIADKIRPLQRDHRNHQTLVREIECSRKVWPTTNREGFEVKAEDVEALVEARARTNALNLIP